MSVLTCAVCGRPAYAALPRPSGRHGNRGIAHPPHTAQEIADHIRSELVRRGYPDPWRETEEGAA